jgi:ribosomal protein S18 acetylase RimI-like enzyme
MLGGQIKDINYLDDRADLVYFLNSAGNSLNSFRYFKNRELSVIKSHIITILFYHNSKPIGYGHIDYDQNIYWLGVCVSDKYFGLGIGRNIVNHLIQKSRRLKINQICLSVDKSNSSAIKLYKNIGFKFYEEKNSVEYYRLSII